jgi:hypothetical protein
MVEVIPDKFLRVLGTEHLESRLLLFGHSGVHVPHPSFIDDKNE